MATTENTRFIFTLAIICGNKPIMIESRDIDEMYFIEDIFSMSVSGKATFTDTKGAIERIESFTSDTAVIIKYGTQEPTSGVCDDEQTKIFYLNSLKAINVNQSRRVRAYEILFSDESYLAFNKLHFSYSWPENTKPEQILNYMIFKMAKINHTEGLWESSNTPLPCYYSPYWNIRQNAQYLIPRARSLEHDVSGYLLYSASDLKDSFTMNLTTLESLLSSKASIEKYNIFDFYMPVRRDEEECKVLDWQIISQDNMNLDFLMGCTFYGYDMMMGKEPIKEDFNYKESIEKTTILGRHTLFAINEIKAGGTQTESDPAKSARWYVDSSREILNNLFYDDWVKRYCQQQMLEVITSGSLKREIGKICQLDMPRTFPWIYDGKEGNEAGYDEAAAILTELHPRWSGKGLIKSITHYFKKDVPHYLQKVVIIKNGYEDLTGPGTLQKAVKTNLGTSIKLEEDKR